MGGTQRYTPPNSPDSTQRMSPLPGAGEPVKKVVAMQVRVEAPAAAKMGQAKAIRDVTENVAIKGLKGRISLKWKLKETTT